MKAGWASTLVDDSQFYMAFAKPERRKLDKHAFSLGGRFWTGPELDKCFETTVIVRVPAYHGFNELLVETVSGERIGWATPDREFTYDDPRGAQTSATRDRERKRALREMQRSVPEIDVLGKLIEIGEGTPNVVPNAPAGVITVDLDGGSGRAIVPARTAKTTRQQMEEEQRRQDEARALLINTAISGKEL